MSLDITVDDVLCEVRDYDDAHHCLRQRVDDLRISRETLDHLSGASSGYAGKVLSGHPTKRAGLNVLHEMLQAVGLRILIAKDPDATERFQHRWTKRDEALVRTGRFGSRRGPAAPIGSSPWERAGELRREQCRRAGKARRKQMSSPEFVEFSRRGGKARAEALTARRRSEIARNAALARWSAHKLATDQLSIETAGKKRRHPKRVVDVSKLPTTGTRVVAQTEA